MAIPIALPQEQETPVSRPITSILQCRYAYVRSHDSRYANDPGQDYLILCEGDKKIAFVLCDGVSQSFFGDLAARLLGEMLLTWLLNEVSQFSTEEQLIRQLSEFLSDLTKQSRDKVNTFSLPDDIPDVLRAVLEEKRIIGSQSMFIAGLINTGQRRVLLSWMGNLRLRIWRNQSDESIPTAFLGAFRDSDRWSSHEGLLGSLHASIQPLTSQLDLVAYSDGFTELDDCAPVMMSDEQIQRLIVGASEAANSDDIVFFHIWNRKNGPGVGEPGKYPFVFEVPLPSPPSVAAEKAALTNIVTHAPIEETISGSNGQTLLAQPAVPESHRRSKSQTSRKKNTRGTSKLLIGTYLVILTIGFILCFILALVVIEGREKEITEIPLSPTIQQQEQKHTTELLTPEFTATFYPTQTPYPTFTPIPTPNAIVSTLKVTNISRQIYAVTIAGETTALSYNLSTERIINGPKVERILYCELDDKQVPTSNCGYLDVRVDGPFIEIKIPTSAPPSPTDTPPNINMESPPNTPTSTSNP